MYRSFKADRDSYITDRIIRGSARTDANLGKAGTLDLFKLYGQNKSGSASMNELSRLLVHFDIDNLREDFANGKFDITSPSFKCYMKLHDVYGGQNTPTNYDVKVYPLSRSWTEGRGNDVVYYQDSDVVNFITASFVNGSASTWYMSGANAKGLLGSQDIDVVASGNFGYGIVDTFATQSFVDGTEDLLVDVTKIVSATLVGLMPDHGFRVSFDETYENDNRTRFVKRFGSRQAINPAVRPQLIVKYDDSRINHKSAFYFDSQGTLFLNNYVRGVPTNLVSGSQLSPVTGSNCMLLKLWTRYSGSSEYSYYATASQHTVGTYPSVGVYSATFVVPTSPGAVQSLITKARLTGSTTPVVFNEVWTSLDETVAYYSGSLSVRTTNATSVTTNPRRYQVNIPNVQSSYAEDDVARFRTFVYDRSNPFYRYVRVPQEEPSVVVETHYSVRDVIADTTVIPFDRVHNSTRMSSDGEHMYFDVWMDCLIPNRTYAIDVMIVDGNEVEIYYDVSPAFNVMPN